MTDPSAYQEHLRRALEAIRTLKDRVRQLEERAHTFAIVGASCRLPGAPTLDAFDALLCSSDDPLVPVPPTRWSVEDWVDDDPSKEGKTPVREGGFLEDLTSFDAGFFGIAPREVRVLDPQHRLLLETTIEALEHAGIRPSSLSGSDTGVFLGISTADHRKLLEKRSPEQIDAWVGTGNVSSTAAGRISYLLNLQGPSLALDTACSSSLVAVHQACQSLAAGESSAAIVGGVQVMLDPEATVYFSKLGALSPTSRCRSFSSDADGYVRSEGAGVVILKRLQDAQDAGDPILAVIEGSAVNQDGRSNGLTAPNPVAQTKVIQTALKAANVSPDAIRHIECHATGTPLGDPIEVEALGNVFGDQTEPITLGAVKSRIGHCEAAAGMAGLLAGALVLARQRVPRNLHLSEPSPHIPWDDLPFVLPTRTRTWTGGRVGVSSFGFGGTNAHVILGPAPETEARDESTETGTLTLTADSEDALRATAGRWADAMQGSQAPWSDWIHTAQGGRDPRAESMQITAKDTTEAAEILASIAEGGPLSSGEPRGDEPPGRRIHTPPTAWTSATHWAVEPASPSPREAAEDPLEGCRWSWAYVPCQTGAPIGFERVDVPTKDPEAWAQKWLHSHRDGPRPLCVAQDADDLILAIARTLGSTHPGLKPLCVTSSLDPSSWPDLAPFQETALSVTEQGVSGARLRPAGAGPSATLSGKTVVVHGDSWLADAAAHLGATVMDAPSEDAVDVLITQAPVDQDAGQVVVIAGWDGWLGSDVREAVTTAHTIAWAKERGATCLRVLLGGRGLDPLPPLARAQALSEALAGDVWIARIDARTYFQSWPARSADPLLSELRPTTGAHEAKPPSTRDELTACVISCAQRVLGLDVIDPSDDLKERGMDSVMALELRGRLERELGRSLPATLAMEHGSVEALVRFLSVAQTPESPVESDEEARLRAELANELDLLEAQIGPTGEDG